MDYSQLSDFEINKLVAVNLNLTLMAEDDTAIPSVRVDDRKGRKSFYADYCNNPSDIMPLMIEHKISLSWTGSYWQALPPLSNHTGGVRGGKDDPLRTGAICFLRMMEAKA